MEIKKGYKQTDIGIIPNDWVVKSFKEISFMKGRIGWQGLNQTEFTTNSDEPFLITGMNFKDGVIRWDEVYHVSIKRYEIAKEIQLKADDILMTKDGTIGKLLYVDKIPNPGMATLNSHLLVFRPIRNSYIPRFLYYQLLSKFFFNFIELNKSGSTFFGISQQAVGTYNVFLPSIKEQTAIATALYDVDKLISKLEMLIEKKRAIKQGAMQQLLKYKEGWKSKKLGEISNVIMGQSPLSKFYNTDGIGLPLIQGNADVENRKTIIRTYTSKITKRAKKGDIIMSVRAPVGEISKATFECCLGRGVCAISSNNEYLYHYLIHFEKSWAKYSTGSTFDSVNSKQVKELEIPIPILDEEQIRIANILTDMDTEITSVEEKLLKYKLLKNGMMQNLLTGKIRIV